jgi:hypothetical protein
MTAKGPKKPEPTSASLERLVECYNAQLPEYNAVVAKLSEGMAPEKVPANLQPMEVVVNGDNIGRDYFIEAIRRQNRRLGRTVRRRALELLEARVKGENGLPMTDVDGRSIGLKYKEVLDIIHGEFPEASTSVACLRWYVVHLRMDANDLGIPWPDLPQIRPRAKSAAQKLAVST